MSEHLETIDHSLIEMADRAFHFGTGRLCLNFTATMASRNGQSFDRWFGTADLARWCDEAGLPVPTKVATRDLAQARDLREAIYRSIKAGEARRKPKPADIALINQWAARPVAAPQLSPDGTKLVFAPQDPLPANLAAIARDAIDLLTGEDLTRLRECAEHSCSVLFVDHSRPGKRRWCSMNRCGNKVKKAAFRERHAETT